MQQLDYLQLHPLEDTGSLEFRFAGIGRNVVVDAEPLLDPLGYKVSVTPKPGYAWGTIRGALDLDTVALEQ